MEPQAENVQDPILVVDDDCVSGQLIGEILAGGGYKIESATSPTDAVEKLSQREYRLMVADVYMPGMSGTTLASLARRTRPGLPILLVSAFPGPTIEMAARALRSPLLAKPFRADALIEHVHKLLGARATEEGEEVAK